MNKIEHDLIEFIETCSSIGNNHHKYPYNNIYDFVLKNGKINNIQPNLAIKTGKMRLCFKNAFNLVEKNRKELKYCEGYAFKIAIPMLHAWAIDDKNSVYDPTWSDGEAYYGVDFPLGYVMKVMLKRKSYGVLDAWDIDFPLLTGEHPYPMRGQYEENFLV